ncbi:MAG TPA: hypothetical protein VKD72_35875 [Gemmataceae bacterium]|nr:hypothetical protein [Gemmataceae bacterium]
MLSPTRAFDILGFSFLGVLLALAALVAGPALQRPRWRWVLTLAALVLTSVAVCQPLAARTPGPWLPPLILAAACLLLCLPFPEHLSATARSRRSRVRGLALAVAVPLGLVGWGLLGQQDVPGEQPTNTAYHFGPAPRVGPEKELLAWTDRGRPVPVSDVRLHTSLPEDEAAEAQMVRAQRRELHLIRTRAPYRGSNCHGWVFTGGHYLVSGSDVERILTDNGYQAVSSPEVGDLVIYHTDEGEIAHTAVVRVADQDLILLESKWGHLGCYVHKPEDYSFAKSWTYYHSPRSGHLLRGLESEESDPPSGPSAVGLLAPAEL